MTLRLAPRIFFRVILSISTMLVLLGLAIVQTVLDELDAAYDAALVRNAETIGRILLDRSPLPMKNFRAMATTPRAPTYDDFPESQLGGPDRFYRVWWDKRLISTSSTPFVEPIPNGFSTSTVGKSVWRLYSGSLYDGHLIVEVGYKKEVRLLFISNIVLDLLFSLLLLTPIIGFFLWGGIQHGLRPIRLLGDEVQLRSENNLSLIPLTDIPGDLHSLGASINLLLSALERSLFAERTFSDHVAHQLRTVQARSKLLLQMLQRTTTRSEQEKLIARLYASNEKSSSMIERLLFLGRASHQSIKLSMFYITEIVSSVLDDLSDLIHEKAINVNVETTNDHYIESDMVLLHVMLENIIENAVKYSPYLGNISIVLSTGGGGSWKMVISDDGPGIPSAKLRAVFQRFYRIEGSSQDGLGLGLSIVKMISERLDIMISLTAPINGTGLIVTLQSPNSYTGAFRFERPV